ncbi:putative holin-like toxin [Clostridium sp.]|nr:putative holin-like toxin [Clostridium sp.]
MSNILMLLFTAGTFLLALLTFIVLLIKNIKK